MPGRGHDISIGGAIVDSGKFPWAQYPERFKRLNEPDVSYHGVVYTQALGAAAARVRHQTLQVVDLYRGDLLGCHYSNGN